MLRGPRVPFELRPGERLDAPPTLRAPTTYQWFRCNPKGHMLHAIPYASHRAYTMRPVDVGHTIKVRMGFRVGREITSSASAVVQPPA